jgi:VanZ family protein
MAPLAPNPWSLRFWWAWLAFITIGSLVPAGLVDAVLPAQIVWDKLRHALGYAVLGWIPMAVRPWLRHARLYLALAIAWGFVIELLQTLTPTRSFELADVVANTLGVAAGACLALAFRSHKRALLP